MSLRRTRWWDFFASPEFLVWLGCWSAVLLLLFLSARYSWQ